jgi:hypothetical protein
MAAYFHGYPNLYANIAQYFLPLWIVGFLQICEQLMYYLIVISCFLQYLRNAESLISSWSITSKPTSTIPNNYIYTEVNLERIFDKIVNKVDCSDIPR